MWFSQVQQLGICWHKQVISGWKDSRRLVDKIWKQGVSNTGVKPTTPCMYQCLNIRKDAEFLCFGKRVHFNEIILQR